MQAKLARKATPILTLENIQTWEAAAPGILKERIKSEIKEFHTPNSLINSKVSLLCQGVSTNLKVDAIVSPANSHLIPGGGLNGAIFAGAGPKLLKECKKIGYCETGKVVKTSGFELPAKYVIHAVGPIGKSKAKLLAQTYSSILSTIDGTEIRSIVIPCISTGLYGFPPEKAANIALESVRLFLEKKDNIQKTDRIIFIVFTPEESHLYMNLFPSFFPIQELIEAEEEEIHEYDDY
ncbi:O-acetyl-ADP-ribose deacetylase MACROD1 [Tritrichomonas foetus]|uniref:O-acetyl-ADP-ribose deacetylase MACROD1 n=1 Tax=Tritrichomonas foetus TaxID=1144522 RepID=A0A1J4KU64_9EUKA|nr:O-acetyl-ADP-ribose deacetylase MACROD1 [Tritrichomonas foetus]|eukprot:OHT14448.1 O-acetyl-ADP-ribose deacetylase MACROD1 [Tritrichomonas foetus]